jgi:uncharacterized protein YndB with AHSA1/START domain
MSIAHQLTVTRLVPAPAKAVFEAWLDPAALVQFMKPMPGMPDCLATLDAKEGGSFAITMMAGDAKIEITGEYKTINRYTELAFTWLSGSTTADSTVTLTFNETDKGECELTLHHVGFENEEACKNHEGGWGSIVEQLSAQLS